MATMEGEKKVEKEKVLPKDAQVSLFLLPGDILSHSLMADLIPGVILPDGVLPDAVLPDDVLHAS